MKKSRSRVRTDEFTVPLRQVGWGWGYGKTYWYRESGLAKAYRDYLKRRGSDG